MISEAAEGPSGTLPWRLVAAVLLLCGVGLLAACGGETPRAPTAIAADIQIPPFARRPYAPFSRTAAIQIAYREWRAFGQKVPAPRGESADSAERDEGLWQRVGEYWWLGLDYGRPEGGWTGKHDAAGVEFPRGEDGEFAWSAAFIDYLMRMAGAGRRFPYSPSHSDYINAARQNPGAYVVSAQPPESYPPQEGDLICMWRGTHPVRFEDLPAGHFPGHCDIVVARHPGTLDTIGGNVDNTVAMKHVPVGGDGRLVGPNGAVLDPDDPWFVVLRVDYQR
jgi:hypothetical protein